MRFRKMLSQIFNYRIFNFSFRNLILNPLFYSHRATRPVSENYRNIFPEVLAEMCLEYFDKFDCVFVEYHVFAVEGE